MKRAFFLLFIHLFISACTDMSSIENKYYDVSYASESDAQQLDIFIPPGKGPFPAVVLIHGGGFRSGDKRSEYAVAKKLVANEYVAICVNYRLKGEAIFPAAVHDVKAAIRFMKGHAEEYKVNPGKIATWGASAGGYLSAMIGTSAGDDYMDGDTGDFDEVPTNIQACVDWFGPINFASLVDDATQLGFSKNYAATIESEFLGVDVNDPSHADLVQKANPITYIDADDPPFYVQAGNLDPLVPYLQSQYFAAALQKELKEGNVSFDLIEGGKHGGSKFSNDENIWKVIAFLDKHLK